MLPIPFILFYFMAIVVAFRHSIDITFFTLGDLLATVVITAVVVTIVVVTIVVVVTLVVVIAAVTRLPPPAPPPRYTPWLLELATYEVEHSHCSLVTFDFA